MSVGMPETIYLEQYGYLLRKVFYATPYHVGSSLGNKTGWRDVDIRLILPDDEWEKWEFGDPEHLNIRWTAYCAAFSELGRKMTGLPIDFQIQQSTWANKIYGSPEHQRSAIGIMWRD